MHLYRTRASEVALPQQRKLPLVLTLMALLQLAGCHTKPPPPTPQAHPEVAAKRPPLQIHDRPINFGEARIEGTLLYRKAHQRANAPRVHTLTIEPKVIVLHFTDSDSLEVTWRYLNRETIESKRPDIAAAGNVNVSTHFLIDRDGTVYRLMPETQFARHCIGLNHVAIGIENIGSVAEPLTEAQALANADLIRNLAARYPQLTHLIGHQEYRQMEGHPYFDERDPNYRTDKVDPGDAFLARVRGLVADLELSGPPS